MRRSLGTESDGRENQLVIGLVFPAEDFRKSLPPSCSKAGKSKVLEQTVKKNKIFLGRSDNDM